MVAKRAYCQKSSVCHQATSSSRSGSVPPCSCRDEDRVLELLVLPTAEGAFGQEPLSDPLQVQWVSATGPAPGQRVGGEAEEDLAGEGVVTRVQRRNLAQQFVDVCV